MKAEQKAAALKQKLAGKILRKVDDVTAAVRDVYNLLNDWHTRLGVAEDAYRADPCKETLAALVKAGKMPLTYPNLMTAAASHPSLEILIYGILDWYETWCDCLRPTGDGRAYASWPPLPRAKGDLVRQWEQTVWFVEVDGVQHRTQERSRWCSPEGHGMTPMDWDAAKEGGYYRLRRERVGKRLRERAADLGWTFVYDTHDGRPTRTLVPYVPGEHRRAMVTIGGPIGAARVGYTHRFPGTERFVPAAVELTGEIELVFIPYGKARQDKVTAFHGTDGTECQTRGRHAPIVQYRTSKLAFARRDLRARDSGESNAYYTRSVQQRKASRIKNARRDVDHAVRLICYAMGDEAGLLMCKQLDAGRIVALGKQIAQSPALCA